LTDNGIRNALINNFNDFKTRNDFGVSAGSCHRFSPIAGFGCGVWSRQIQDASGWKLKKMVKDLEPVQKRNS